MRVLVVEDEADLGDVFRDFLLQLGHQPLVVRSAEAALGTLRTQRPDAIILDIRLPGMSGLDFLQLRPVRELGVPIVAVSGVVTEQQARECLRLGAADFVGKPVAFDRLHEVLMYLEPAALARAMERPPRVERRRQPRVPLAVPVRVVEYGGDEHEGTSVELGTAGIKVRVPGYLPLRSVVRLTLTPPDDGRAITVISLVMRRDADGHAFAFVNLDERERQRLEAFVRRRAGG
jgi:CheY-like chemotaxis protein